VGGSLTVASFNVLNYFTTIDDGTNDICGPEENQECRGADSSEEFTRQRTKIIAALAEMDADVVGLIEIENHPADVPTDDLVSGLNDMLGAGTYAYIPTGAIGSDAIRVALIYKSGTVAPVGAYAILDSDVDARFDDSLNRPVLAQAFEETATGGTFSVAVNHLKSKGSACGPGDDDPQQGNCNGTRTAAAEAMVDWLAGDPTASGDLDYLIMGDLNAYDKEDPIDVLRAGADGSPVTSDDFTDLVEAHSGELAYSYLFDGQLGYLDHALAGATIASQVTGATVWHINADEPDILDYDTTFKQNAQDALYEPNAYRSSDHDPVIVGLDLLAYDFDGYYPPVANPPAINAAKAGSVVALRFSLGGDFGLDVLWETPQVFSCGDWPLGTSSDALTPGKAGLSYNSVTDEYVFKWKTARSWPDSCRTVVMTFDDGTYRSASFGF
jgi:predicted extracellular nuclease